MEHLVQTVEGGPPLSEEEVRLFEMRHGLGLPGQYRQFLLSMNGGRPERDLFTIDGLPGNPIGRIHLFFGLNDPIESCNLDWNLGVFAGRVPEWLIPIATTEGADKICLATAGDRVGGVFYWDAHAHPGAKSIYLLADGFGAFVSSLQSDELSPRVLKV
ncbi:SMI1/KNR4 family protein [Myxococcus qinghaiensis]|uniref:SMI1/KNR4 family protein n=1 Tax=Myxococcus qinghaiensis TaxID=2906758 RepID=UPI0020A74D86|nr:SMI1/KNR4 family protein [Myxococcus qinghaiensis]MCP3167405.1 SMI1/KNR4 family protein [Myxococcus qinghaiensis]